MKGIPRHAGAVVDRICNICGIDSRIAPGRTQLHRTEAISILSYLQEMQKQTKTDKPVTPANMDVVGGELNNAALTHE